MMDVAIVGIGCRLPGKVHGAPTSCGTSCSLMATGSSRCPQDRWSLDRYYDPGPGHAWPDVHPQRRVPPGLAVGLRPRSSSGGHVAKPRPWTRSNGCWLEVTQEAMDDAGVPGRVAGRPVGVYIGAFTVDNMVLRNGGS